MRKITLAMIIAMLAGCATTTGVQKDTAAPQYYKLAGADHDIKISGTLSTPWEEKAGNVKWHRMLSVAFDDQEVVNGYLESNSAQGEVSGKYQDHSVNAVCSSLKTSETNLQVDCMILVDNQRTATLRF